MLWKILFDSECPMCCRFSNIIKGMDKNGDFLLESYQNYSVYNDSPVREELSQEIHIINNNGEIRHGSEAVTTILSILPGLRPYRWMIESRWGKRGTIIMYKSLKRYGKCRSCR